MNSGIADAAGLSWVLAACVQGWGDESLLDAYDAERRPTAWWHLEAARRHMGVRLAIGQRSEEHTSEPQSLMRTSYAVFCLQKKKAQRKPHIVTKSKVQLDIP